jgi:hypothetical protein
MFSANSPKLYLQYPHHQIPKGSLYLTLIYLNYAELDLILSTTTRSSIISHPFLAPAKSSTSIRHLLAPDQKCLTCFEPIHAIIVFSQVSFSKCRCVKCPPSQFAFFDLSPLIQALLKQIDLTKILKGLLTGQTS